MRIGYFFYLLEIRSAAGCIYLLMARNSSLSLSSSSLFRCFSFLSDYQLLLSCERLQIYLHTLYVGKAFIHFYVRAYLRVSTKARIYILVVFFLLKFSYQFWRKLRATNKINIYYMYTEQFSRKATNNNML